MELQVGILCPLQSRGRTVGGPLQGTPALLPAADGVASQRRLFCESLLICGHYSWTVYGSAILVIFDTAGLS
jgi:hypothetical protein